MKTLRLGMLGLFAIMLLLSAGVYAQNATSGTLVGMVKDTSGAVLPGVTVEAASPALIEKVRTVIDGHGRPLPSGRPAPRRVHGDVLAPWIWR